MSTQGDDMTTDSLTKAAYVLLDEAATLIRANAVGPEVHRHLAASDAWRAQYRAAKEAPAPAPKTCGSPVSGGRNCGDTTVATGSPITIVCGRCRTGRPPVDGARCRACGHYETSIEHATEKYAHCPSCGRAPHWMPVTNDDPANDSNHSEWSVHPTGTVADILASEPIPAPAPEPSAQPAGVPTCKGGRGKCGTRVEDLGGPALWGFELEGLWFCSQECRTEHIKATTPHPSDPVTVCDDKCRRGTP